MLRIEGLSKSFGGNRALRHLTVSLEAGQLVALIGPNGSGKTTLLDAVCGLIPVDGGQVVIAGADASALPPWRRAPWLARTFQTLKLTASLSAEENVMLHLQGQHGTRLLDAAFRRRRWMSRDDTLRRAARDALAAFELDEHAATTPDRLSYGQQKLVSLAGVLASGRPIALLDEPFTGLDLTRVSAVAQRLRAEADGGRTVVFVEHNLGVVADTASRALALDNGVLIADGRPADVLASDRLTAAYLK